jgi:hypothetical protein
MDCPTTSRQALADNSLGISDTLSEEVAAEWEKVCRELEESLKRFLALGAGTSDYFRRLQGRELRRKPIGLLVMPLEGRFGSQPQTSPSTANALSCPPNLRAYSAYLHRLERADERTRTAYPCSLRVIHQALQGFAQPCKCRISKRLSLLRFALCCTVLRSQWYQSGIKGPPEQ